MDVFEVLNLLIAQCMRQHDLQPVALEQIQDGLVAQMEANPARNWMFSAYRSNCFQRPSESTKLPLECPQGVRRIGP